MTAGVEPTLSRPQVSVLMPAYNAAPYVRAAVSSLIAQAHRDWELIAVDDGSTDATGEILASFADPRIRVIRQANRGEGAARNAALEAASGRYFAFLDADDLYLPGALESMVAYLESTPGVDVVLCDGYFCDRNGRPLMRLSEHRPGPYEGDILEPLVLSPSVVTVPVCTMARGETIARAGVRFDPTLVFGVDWDFWIHLARSARFGHLDRLTCMYRLHDQSVTGASTPEQRRASLLPGRLKVMNSAWFGGLSLRTRCEFLNGLLTSLLHGDVDAQAGVLQSTPFRSLPAAERARLLRLVASRHLQEGGHVEFASGCLEEAIALHPSDLRARALRAAMRANAPLARLLLRGWNGGRRLCFSLRRLVRRGPKPVPKEPAFGDA